MAPISTLIPLVADSQAHKGRYFTKWKRFYYYYTPSIHNFITNRSIFANYQRNKRKTFSTHHHLLSLVSINHHCRISEVKKERKEKAKSPLRVSKH